MHRHELTDEQWLRIRPLIPQTPGPRSKLGDRTFLNAVLWRAKTGVPWRDLPSRYGPYKTVFNRFSRWAQRGVWERIFKELQFEIDEVGSLLDGSIVRAHQDAAGGKGGSSAIVWDVLLGVSPHVFMRSRRRRANRST
jgi:transposase